MCCGSAGERVSRHNALRDALYSAAVSASLGPSREGRFLLPGDDRRPADVLVPHWTGGQDTAWDVTVIHPLQAATVAGAAASPATPWMLLSRGRTGGPWRTAGDRE